MISLLPLALAAAGGWYLYQRGAAAPAAPPPSAGQVKGASVARAAAVRRITPAAITIAQRNPSVPWLLPVCVAQAMLETGWGRAVPGNNWYGIKGKGPAGSVTVPTREEFAPGIVTRQRSAFRAYADPAESVRDWARFVTRGQYAPALTMKSPGSAALWIWSQGYATSSRYVPALARWSQIAAQSTGAAALAFELSAAHKALAAQLATLPAGKARKTSARTLLHSGRWPA